MKNTTCFLWLACAGVLGCGNEGSPISPDAATPASDANADGDTGVPTRGADDAAPVAPGCEHTGALCTKLNQCAPFLLAATYGDLTTCTSRTAKACTAQAYSDGSGMTAANLLACKNALANATCDDVFANNLPCNFNGTMTDGTACGENSQCAGGFCNRQGGTCGVCASKAGAGAACASGNNDECQSGLVCSKSKTCVAPARAAETCDDNTRPCLMGLFCTAANTCAYTVAAGAECPGPYLDLAKGILCWGRSTPANPQLAAQIGTAETGRPCGLAPAPGQPATLCAPGGIPACTLVPGGIPFFGVPTKGMCAAPVPDGYTCDATSVCEPGAQCISGMCTIPSGKLCPGAAGP